MVTNIAVLDLTMCCKGRYWGSDGAVDEDSGFPGCHVMSNGKQYRRFGRAKCLESVSNYSTYVPVERAWYLRTLWYSSTPVLKPHISRNRILFVYLQVLCREAHLFSFC